MKRLINPEQWALNSAKYVLFIHDSERIGTYFVYGQTLCIDDTAKVGKFIAVNNKVRLLSREQNA